MRACHSQDVKSMLGQRRIIVQLTEVAKLSIDSYPRQRIGTALAQSLQVTRTSSVRKRCVQVVSINGVTWPCLKASSPGHAIMAPLSMQ